MRIYLIAFLLAFTFSSMAQDDNESLPDIRNKRESFLKFPKGELRDDLAAFTLGGIDERLGKKPLQMLAATDFSSNSITFEGDKMKVVIGSGRFEPSKHKLFYYYQKYLVKIDGKPFYGDYGKVPTTAITSVRVILDKDTIDVPQSALVDLYHPDFIYTDGSGTVRTHNAVYLSADKHKMYIYMLNSETIGHYEVTWIIQDKKYVGRVVDSGLMR